jgi:hypothetical protein
VGRFERRDCSPDRGKETVGPDPGGEARLLEDLALPSLQAGETERDPALLELHLEASQHVDRVGFRNCVDVSGFSRPSVRLA